MAGRKPIGDFVLDSQFTLRLPSQLRKELEKHARRNQRSLAQEIITRLDESIRMPDRWNNYASLKEAGY